MGPIEPINKFTQTQSKLQKLQTFLYTKKCRGSWKKKVFFFFFWGGTLGFNTLCNGCSSHMTFVELLYLREDKSDKVCTDYKN